MSPADINWESTWLAVAALGYAFCYGSWLAYKVHKHLSPRRPDLASVSPPPPARSPF